MRSEPGRDGPLLIPQVSHAWLAWQVAEHWGNRRFRRPEPLAEALAAVLLHDSGWPEFDRDPGVGADGRPHTFDRMPADAHLGIWRESVLRAAQHARYAGLLVARHFRGLARFKEEDAAARGDGAAAAAARDFRRELGAMENAWTASLADDLRAAPFLDGVGRRTNQRILAFCDRLSVTLCAGFESGFAMPVIDADGSEATVRAEPLGERRWRIAPWPLEGTGLTVHCEGRRLDRAVFESREALREALRSAPVERLSFTLLRPSRAARGG